MASAFPELPRPGCDFVPDVDAISGPLVPKPLWAGASSYDDPAYPSGGGPDDVPPAAPAMGQAIPASNISPPAQTSMGGGGGAAASIPMVEVVSLAGTGQANVQPIQLKANPGIAPNYELTPGSVSSLVTYLIR